MMTIMLMMIIMLMMLNMFCTDFMKQGITDVNSFEWASQLQHQIEIKPVLSSSYQGDNNDSSCTSKTIPINRLYEVVSSFQPSCCNK